MPDIQCPTFIVHGQKDTLIPITQAQQLNDACGGPTCLLSPPMMTHNDFDFYEDLIRPLMKFLIQMNILASNDSDGSDQDGLNSDTSEDEATRRLDSKSGGRKSAAAGTNPRHFSQTLKIQGLQGLHQLNQVKFDEEFFIPPKMKESYQTSQTRDDFSNMGMPRVEHHRYASTVNRGEKPLRPRSAAANDAQNLI